MIKNELTKITDDEIATKISNGTYSNDEKAIRDKASGRIVKFIKESTQSVNHIPPSIIQINNTYVYTMNESNIINAILNDHKVQVYRSLEASSGTIRDLLSSYKTFNDSIDELFSLCLSTSNSFEVEIDSQVKKFLKSSEFIDENDISIFINTLNMYVRILLIYILSTYKKNKEKFSEFKPIVQKIETFKKSVCELYQQLIMKKTRYSNNKDSLEGSLYMLYFFDKNSDKKELLRMIHHDTRYNDLTHLLNDITDNFLYGYIGEPRFGVDTNQFREVKIAINAKKVSYSSNKHEFIKKLLDILDDIERLENIIQELIEVDDDILSKYLLN